MRIDDTQNYRLKSLSPHFITMLKILVSKSFTTIPPSLSDVYNDKNFRIVFPREFLRSLIFSTTLLQISVSKLSLPLSRRKGGI